MRFNKLPRNRTVVVLGTRKWLKFAKWPILLRKFYWKLLGKFWIFRLGSEMIETRGRNPMFWPKHWNIGLLSLVSIISQKGVLLWRLQAKLLRINIFRSTHSCGQNIGLLALISIVSQNEPYFEGCKQNIKNKNAFQSKAYHPCNT